MSALVDIRRNTEGKVQLYSLDTTTIVRGDAGVNGHEFHSFGMVAANELGKIATSPIVC